MDRTQDVIVDVRSPAGTCHIGTLTAETNFNFQVRPGQIVGFLEARNSTFLFRLILGLGTLSTGTIDFPSLDHLRKNENFYINFGLAQREKGLLSNLNILENVELPARYHNIKVGELGPDELTHKALREAIIPENFWNLRPDHIPWEIKKRTILARAVVCLPKIVLLEDPTNMFRWEKLPELFHWIKLQQTEKRATLLCTENIPFALSICDSVWNAETQKLETVDQYLEEKGTEWSTFITQMRKQLEVSCVST